MELKGSQTEKNLWAAFAGESQARNKYTYYASKAKKDGFDNDKFFRSYAQFWLSKFTKNTALYYLTDEHPMPYLRVNCVLQQFDEFCDLYDIKEGDGMYLAPEDRVNIW